jgi:acyl-CoA reductase-like NAD-dependent aldehyde dehydrogenase
MDSVEPFLVGDSWVHGSAEPILSVNPANGALNARVSSASDKDLDRAVSTAEHAFRSSSWKDWLPHQRADKLRQIACLLDERGDDIARTVMCENGKTFRECRSQVRSAAGIFRYYAGVGETMEAEVTPARGDYITLTQYEPMGVVAAITPWNSPINIAADKLAPALAAGNAVILKPSEITPLAGLAVGKVCKDAGIPPGIVNVVPATAGISAMLVRHAGISMISFTGGTVAGKAIAAAAADRLIPVLLELGGKSPHIVCDDCDVERAAAGVAFGIFSSMGQTCVAGSRLFVHRAVRDRIVEKVVAIAKSLRIGMPGDEQTQFGPLASIGHRDRVASLVDGAVKEGGSILTGGRPPAGTLFTKGAFYEPTVIDGLSNRAALCQTEIFGPVLCVLTFDDDDELVHEANDTVYGLACGIWSGNFSRAWHIAKRIQAGTVWINTYRQNSVTTPFGGFKQSGLGRERGRQALRQYQQVKSVFLGIDRNAAAPGHVRSPQQSTR